MAAKSKTSRFDVYEAVTAQVVAALEAGTVPWRKPWSGGDGIQMNARTRKPYRGINQFLLGMTGYGQPYWLTAKQAFAVGASIKDGQPRKDGGPGPTLVIFWKQSKYRAKAGDEGARIDPDTGQWTRESFLLRYYNVWNVEQLEGLPDGFVPTDDSAERTPHERDDACERVLRGYVGEQSIRFTEAGGRAYYAPSVDAINVPPLDAFEHPEAFYSTAFHECVHSTGHGNRLARPSVTDSVKFGSEPYGKEELVAEMGAAMTCALLQIDTAPITDNRDAYIASWLDTIKGDSKLVVQAAAQAQKATDYLIGDRYAELLDVTPWDDGAVADESGQTGPGEAVAEVTA